VGSLGNIEIIEYAFSTEELRNKVVVFGRDDIYAEASAASPHLPSGFYKTAIVSSELIDTQDMADDSATYNLELYNKLTENLRVEAEGNPLVRCRDIVGVTEPFTSMAADLWFVYAVDHDLDENGYSMSLTLSK